MAGTFDTDRVNDGLRHTQFHGGLHHFLSIDSTNTRALADAQAGAPGGQVYIADEQTAGRGRGGHTWHSEPDRGLYLTALVRPALSSRAAWGLSLAAGIAASISVEAATGYRLDLRWPNDLVAPHDTRHSRKLGGVLTESASTAQGHVRFAAIGIGINLNQLSFPQELAGEATSLRAETGQPVTREQLAIALLRCLDEELRHLQAGTEDICDRFAARSTWVHGKRVRVGEDGGYTGVTVGLTDAGLLRVRCSDDLERVVRHGGVREG